MYQVEIIIPVYNDITSLSHLLKEINSIKSEKYIFLVTIIDDFSDIPISKFLSLAIYENIKSIKVLRLHTNMGHQKAISIGLFDAIDGDTHLILIMDGDGEDNPNNINILLDEALVKQSVVVASRKSRYESVVFKIFYFIYRLLFVLATGLKMNFGNFSVIPRDFLNEIINLKSCGVHYPGTILKSGVKLEYVPLNRSKRYHGSSKMNFSSLILHGFNSFVLFKQKIISRILIFNFISILFGIFTDFTIFQITAFLIAFILSNVLALFLLIMLKPKELNYKNINLSKLLLK